MQDHEFEALMKEREAAERFLDNLSSKDKGTKRATMRILDGFKRISAKSTKKFFADMKDYLFVNEGAKARYDEIKRNGGNVIANDIHTAQQLIQQGVSAPTVTITTPSKTKPSKLSEMQGWIDSLKDSTDAEIEAAADEEGIDADQLKMLVRSNREMTQSDYETFYPTADLPGGCDDAFE